MVLYADKVKKCDYLRASVRNKILQGKAPVLPLPYSLIVDGYQRDAKIVDHIKEGRLVAYYTEDSEHYEWALEQAQKEITFC